MVVEHKVHGRGKCDTMEGTLTWSFLMRRGRRQTVQSGNRPPSAIMTPIWPHLSNKNLVICRMSLPLYDLHPAVFSYPPAQIIEQGCFKMSHTWTVCVPESLLFAHMCQCVKVLEWEEKKKKKWRQISHKWYRHRTWNVPPWLFFRLILAASWQPSTPTSRSRACTTRRGWTCTPSTT